MKKTYMKPYVEIERYELTQAIASCAIKIGFLDSDCVKNDSDATKPMKDYAWDGYFIDKCSEIISEDMNFEDGICYHTSANAAFTS